jgi:OOP family OmpA-OmpF porin
MTTLINGRTPEQDAAWNRWHSMVAMLLALLLVLLWLMGRGPGSAMATGACCGTSAVALDSDSDGVLDADDACPATPAGTNVDGRGCDLAAAAPLDTDGDGVVDTGDDCPGTAAGVTVDARGCEPATAVAAPAAAPVPAANLYFDTDRFDLPADAAAKMADIVAYLKTHPTAVAVVSGYHDPRGDREHNIQLAKNRAFSVRDHLVANGIAETQIDMVKPLETTGDGDLQEARRVEVSVRP